MILKGMVLEIAPCTHLIFFSNFIQGIPCFLQVFPSFPRILVRYCFAPLSERNIHDQFLSTFSFLLVETLVSQSVLVSFSQS